MPLRILNTGSPTSCPHSPEEDTGANLLSKCLSFKGLRIDHAAPWLSVWLGMSPEGQAGESRQAWLQAALSQGPGCGPGHQAEPNTSPFSWKVEEPSGYKSVSLAVSVSRGQITRITRDGPPQECLFCFPFKVS